MSDSTLRSVYRVDIGDSDCRSREALVSLNVAEIEGVEVVAPIDRGSLVIVTSTDRDLYEELVRAVVASGLDPESVMASDFERRIDPLGVALDEAIRLGLVAEPKRPVRAEIEQLQRISVEVTDGYDPDTIIITAGVPAEIRFSEGHGCLGRVVFDDLGVEVDLEDGGATVRIPELEPGTYGFRCGMDMVHGTLIVE